MLQSILSFFVPAAQAHEKWFVTEGTATAAQAATFTPGTHPFTIAVTVAAVLSAVGFAFDRRFERSAFYAKTELKLHAYRDFVPGVIAVCTGILLLWSSYHGVLLADNFPLPPGLSGTVLQAVQAAIGVMLLAGFGTATAAMGLMFLYVAAVALYGWVEGADYLYIAGISMFLLFFARGRYSLDWFYGKALLSSPTGRKHAYLVMRVLAGMAFFALSLLKWFHPEVHIALMERYAAWNPYVLLDLMHIRMTRETYVLCLATVESTAAIYVTAGLLTRAAALVLFPIFIASIFFLGPAELVGHLPILGILFALFIFGDTYHKHAPPAEKAALDQEQRMGE